MHLDLDLELEGLLGFDAFLTSHAAMDAYDSFFLAEESADSGLEVVKGVPVLGEDDNLLPGRGLGPG